MKRRSGGTKKRGGRPFGETSSMANGKGKMMTRYTRPSGGSNASMRITGRKATANGRGLLKGMSKSLPPMSGQLGRRYSKV